MVAVPVLAVPTAVVKVPLPPAMFMKTLEPESPLETR